jgi:RHS repeat-associated protein
VSACGESDDGPGPSQTPGGDSDGATDGGGGDGADGGGDAGVGDPGSGDAGAGDTGAADEAAPVIITSQPTSQSVVEGAAATFDVVAAHATRYQWQRSDDGGASFVDLPGETTASTTTPATTMADDGAGFRVVVGNAGSTVTSAIATLTVIDSGLPPDPATTAPPLDPTAAIGFALATAFLYTGVDPIQTGVMPGTIEERRAAVLRGRVMERDLTALAGVTISVLGHPELGQTASRADGLFDLAVNGGGRLVVQYEKDGFLPAQRALDVPWRDYAWLPDVVLISLDPMATVVELDSGVTQVARGSVISDGGGTRQATVLIPAGTSATLILPDGATEPLATVTIRATEFTVGAQGPQAMPAVLPPVSGYTYAAELSLDEALAAGASEVRFTQALPVYLENFLAFPVGSAVPAGWYDRQVGSWIASENGRVVEVLAVTDSRADLDTDGDGAADAMGTLAALGVTDDERAHLAQLYAPGQTLWRVPVAHFTPWDFNWPYGPPADAVAPPAQVKKKPRVKKPNEECGSIIGCEDQSLGEAVPITGTSWWLHYQSARTPGRKDAYTLTIPVSGATVPASLTAMRVEVEIAGRSYRADFAPAANVVYDVTWDGEDGYGRTVYGEQTASVRVDYVYPVTYFTVASDAVASFARAAGTGAAISSPRGVDTYTLSQTWAEPLHVRDLRRFGQGGWSLSVQHFYDAASRTLSLGTGQELRAEALPPVTFTVAGNGTYGTDGDGGPATAATLTFGHGLAVGPDGSLFLADANSHRIRRVDAAGVITTVAGTGASGFDGDGGQATATRLWSPFDVAVGPDGSLYIADFQNRRVRRVSADGIITTVAGNGQNNSNGDGGPATAAAVGGPTAVALATDGSLYLADGTYHRIRRVGTDGIITTVAGNGIQGFDGDGGPAVSARLSNPVRMALAPDGSLIIADRDNRRVRRVGTDGIITTVAGSGTAGFGGDGGPAVAAALNQPAAVAVARDGSLFVTDGTQRIRRVGPDGIITTVAGNGDNGFGGEGGPATAATLGSYDYRGVAGLALGPDGSLYFGEYARVRVVRPVLPGFVVSDVLVPSEDGRELWVFDANGRHQRTLDATTGTLRHELGYDAGGYLVRITDGDGNVTHLERSGGAPAAIVAPGGQRTELAVGGDGWLSAVIDPLAQAHTMTYAPLGLLETFTDPRGSTSRFFYDGLGRLSRDEDPHGGSVTLARTDFDNGYAVTTTTALGRARTYRVEALPTGAVRRTVIGAGGEETTTLVGTDGSEQTTWPDGGSRTVTYGPDPRFGMAAPIVAQTVETTPAGRVRTVTTSRAVTLADPTDLLSVTLLADTVTVNGAVSTRVYSDDGTTRTLTYTSPAGRSRVATFDAAGRVVEARAIGLDPVVYAYDGLGRLSSISAGSRVTTLTWDAAFDLTGVVEPLGRSTTMTYDDAGRTTTRTLPGGGTVTFAYDGAGNVITVTPPGRSPHNIAYTPIGLEASYTPPAAGAGSAGWSILYDADGAVARVTRADGQLIDLGYDAAGRVDTLEMVRGTIVPSYGATSGQLLGLMAPGALGLDYAYDGGLLTSVTWSGAVSGSTAYTYDDFLRISGQSVNGAGHVTFTYDADGLLLTAGGLTLTHHPQTGQLSGSSLGSLTDSFSYDALGALSSTSASWAATGLYSATHTRDGLGRIVQTDETIAGATEVWVYDYDSAGRLSAVTLDGLPFGSYDYDDNGNLVSHNGVSATYDAQDRLESLGSATYAHSADGERQSRTQGADTTSYHYDALGQLHQVTLPDGTIIDYLVDGENRRVGKRVDGVLVRGFLYEGALRPVAELDGSNAVVSRFVYATRANVPDYMTKEGATYRIITDVRGSPRLVVDVATGAVAQRLDYDAFGRVLVDTLPGFQPFGFAGGLYDPDTGLVRFGARDYDAQTGRWTTKDPLGFGGGDPNLYACAGNDPVNVIDSDGLAGVNVGGELYIRNQGVKLLHQPRLGANATADILEPGDVVTWLGYDSATGFDRIELTRANGVKCRGFTLRSNLTTKRPAREIELSPVPPFSTKSFPSHAVGIKG